MADVTQPNTGRLPSGEHTNRCYWDLDECRWVCHHETGAVPDEKSARPDDGQ